MNRKLAHRLAALAATLAVTAATAGAAHAAAPAEPHALTRAEVRAALFDARDTNRITPSNEIGDTPDVLQAREDFNALQTEVLGAQAAQPAGPGLTLAGVSAPTADEPLLIVVVLPADDEADARDDAGII